MGFMSGDGPWKYSVCAFSSCLGLKDVIRVEFWMWKSQYKEMFIELFNLVFAHENSCLNGYRSLLGFAVKVMSTDKFWK